MEDDAHASHPRAARNLRHSDASHASGVRAHASANARGAFAATVAQVSAFDEVIDVRSQGEYAEDHIPGAINCPVLHDAERALVGTIYKQQSSFDAKKMGAALVAANIASHLRERFHDRPRSWRPLVYCWRGGGRSEAMAHVLAQVGWRAGRLEGGYKAYRRHVSSALETLPQRYVFRVLCGLTGTGKSRLLGALHEAGAQVLDLERLAAHRGSVLGNIPEEPQPTQKYFDSLLWSALESFDTARPIFIESESRKIGRLRVPEALIQSMWASECVVLDASLPVRSTLLKQEYAHYMADFDALAAQLDCLTSLHGKERIALWRDMAGRRDWDALVSDLLARHYDPSYTRSTLTHYPALDRARHFAIDEVSPAAFRDLAQRVLEVSTKDPARGNLP